jgi:ferritin-like metal-binding protein YciE
MLSRRVGKGGRGAAIVCTTLLAWAEHLGEDEIVELLSETLEEERHADELLSSIAEGGVNATASERAEAAV